MPSDNDPKPTPSAEPFRKPAVWGRPPQTTFRAGPLPRGERLPPLPEPPAAVSAGTEPAVIAKPSAAVPPQQQPQPVGTRPDIFSGSMIPRAAYKPTSPLPTQKQAQAGSPAGETSSDTSPAPSAPDLTVRPLPTPAPAPAPVAATTGPTVPVAHTPEPLPILTGRSAKPPAEALAATSPIIPTRARKASKASRMPLIAGGAVAALAVVGAGVWWINRAPVAPVASSAPANTVPASTEAVPALVPEIDAAPAPTAAESTTGTSTPTTVPVAPPLARAETTPAPRTTTPTATRPAPARTPAPTPAPTVQSPPPVVIEIASAQPSGPPPTTAAQPTNDPDAPVVTRPQPLD